MSIAVSSGTAVGFYLDFIGDRTAAPVPRALARLAAQAENLRILGSYPRAG